MMMMINRNTDQNFFLQCNWENNNRGVNEELKNMLARLGTRIIDECGPNIREMVNMEIEKLALQMEDDAEQDLSSSMTGITHTRRYTERENQESLLYLRRKSISEDPDSLRALWISATWRSVQRFIEKMKNYMEGLFANVGHFATPTSNDESSSSSNPRRTMYTKQTIISGILGIAVSMLAGYLLMEKLGYLELGLQWIRSMIQPPSL